jgi:hypothetical protein
MEGDDMEIMMPTPYHGAELEDSTGSDDESEIDEDSDLDDDDDDDSDLDDDSQLDDEDMEEFMGTDSEVDSEGELSIGDPRDPAPFPPALEGAVVEDDDGDDQWEDEEEDDHDEAAGLMEEDDEDEDAEEVAAGRGAYMRGDPFAEDDDEFDEDEDDEDEDEEGHEHYHNAHWDNPDDFHAEEDMANGPMSFLNRMVQHLARHGGIQPQGQGIMELELVGGGWASRSVFGLVLIVLAWQSSHPPPPPSHTPPPHPERWRLSPPHPGRGAKRSALWYLWPAGHGSARGFARPQ